MAWHNVTLIVFHSIYSLCEFIFSLYKIVFARRGSEPKPLHYPRRQQPQHLALALTCPPCGTKKAAGEEESIADAMLESVRRVATWSSEIGIDTLTVYDRHGVLKNHSRELEYRLGTSILSSLDDSIQHSVTRQKTRSRTSHPPTYSDPYLTPPDSDDSSATSSLGDIDCCSNDILTFDLANTPSQLRRFHHLNGNVEDSDGGLVHLRRHQEQQPTISEGSESPLLLPPRSVRVHVISSSNGLPAIARAARSIARSYLQQSAALRGSKKRPSLSSPSQPLNVTVPQLDEIISADFPAPHFLIVHNLNAAATRIERSLDAFPPWQLRLTEIHHTAPRLTLSSLFEIKKGGSYCVPINEWAFRVALDEYAQAEMREGK